MPVKNEKKIQWQMNSSGKVPAHMRNDNLFEL